jgi:hypothetical protein
VLDPEPPAQAAANAPLKSTHVRFRIAAVTS